MDKPVAFFCLNTAQSGHWSGTNFPRVESCSAPPLLPRWVPAPRGHPRPLLLLPPPQSAAAASAERPRCRVTAQREHWRRHPPPAKTAAVEDQHKHPPEQSPDFPRVGSWPLLLSLFSSVRNLACRSIHKCPGFALSLTICATVRTLESHSPNNHCRYLVSAWASGPYPGDQHWSCECAPLLHLKLGFHHDFLVHEQFLFGAMQSATPRVLVVFVSS